MIAKSRAFWPLLIFVAAVQTVALGKIVFDRDRLLKTGREITLPVRPIDPRDLFRGDYVTLGYEITTIHRRADFQSLHEQGIVRGATVYVTLTPDVATSWKVSGLDTSYPTAKKEGDVVLRGRVNNLWAPAGNADASIVVSYGIEQYFVPEGEGKAIEAKVREHKTDAVIAVAADGTAALKGIVVDGKRYIDPPLL